MSRIVKVSVNNLQADHLVAFNRTLRNILSTTHAQRIFAQIIDGLPTRNTVGGFQVLYQGGCNDNPSPEAMEAAHRLQENFDTYITLIDAKLAQAYQESLPGSREFYMRLLEMLAVACHDIAAFVYINTQPGLRREGPSPAERLFAGRPTDFFLEEYGEFEQYPKGVADVVGYWAECLLFGGVVLFDRGESGTDCKRAFLHPVGRFKIFQISEGQIQQFAEYVQQFDTTACDIQPPFPLQAERYTYRVDSFDSMNLNIYRDKYERIIPKMRPRTSCVTAHLEDDPALQDALAEVKRGLGW